jgi:hypothetical protein
MDLDQDGAASGRSGAVPDREGGPVIGDAVSADDIAAKLREQKIRNAVRGLGRIRLRIVTPT